MKSVLVTGSSGFLGSAISKLAVHSGYQVLGIDIRPSSGDPTENFTFLKANLAEFDFQSIEKHDMIIHTASSLPYGNSKTDFTKNNTLAAKKVALFARETSSFLVELGSSSVYGRPADSPITRNTPLRPLDEYAKSKLQAEIEIGNILPSEKFAVIRPRTILGGGRGGIFEVFFSLVKRQIPIPLPNAGRQVIQFSHVKDLARLSIFLGENQISGVWPAASPFPKPLRTHLKELQLLAKLPIRYIEINPSLFYSVGLFAYHTRLTKFTPWHFGAFPFDSYFEDKWIPKGFNYEYSSSEAFLETWEAMSNEALKRVNFVHRIGRVL
jgi:nucleoside-diphosphate-sugar epimerase